MKNIHTLKYLYAPLRLAAVDPGCRLIVTIPAKDETGYIRATLDALRRQFTPGGSPLPPARYEVIVLANNCRDATASVCRQYARQHPTFRLRVAEVTLSGKSANVGTARRIMMDTAHRRFCGLNRPNGVICTTDADTLVDREWAYHILASVRRGARAVGGRITAPHDVQTGRGGYRRHHLQDVTYRSLQYCLESIIDPDPADPWPRHFQHFGPSIAVRADAYAACGGIPPLSSLEDVALVRALERVDIPVTHDPAVRVVTSSRVSHRVEGTAFSHQLDEWAQLKIAQRVIGLENCLRLFKWKVALRRAYRRGNVESCPRLRSLAVALDRCGAGLAERANAATSFGQLYQQIRIDLEGCPVFCSAPIDRAIRELRQFTRSQRHRGAGTLPVGSDPLALPVPD